MRLPSLFVRTAVYLAVIVALLLVRFGGEWRRLLASRTSRHAGVATLLVSGSDVAPELVRRLVAMYAADYPELEAHVEGGGTAVALESVLTGRSDVAFSLRAPSPDELRSAERDTLPCFPIALGGLVLIRSEAARFADVSFEDLQSLARGEAPSRVEAPARLYAPDPSLGLWHALTERLAVDPSIEAADRVVFLKDVAAVLPAVRADARAVGLASTWTLPAEAESLVVGVIPAGGGAAVLPTREDVATGAYPLHHFLYAACLLRGQAPGAMFVTHFTSDHGQRQIERAGFLPARRAAREIYLTTHSVGHDSNGER